MSQNTASLRGTTILMPAQTQTQLQLRLQPKAQMHPQIQTHGRMQPPIMPQTHLQPQPPQVHAPPPTVRICCSGCSKVLQKGQTAFQRKGSNQLFCSTVCLTSFSLPSVQFTPIIAPKKTCHLCLKWVLENYIIFFHLCQFIDCTDKPHMFFQFLPLNSKEVHQEIFALCHITKIHLGSWGCQAPKK